MSFKECYRIAVKKHFRKTKGEFYNISFDKAVKIVEEENIDKLIIEISDCENKLEMLERANNRSEIVELLNEFSVESVEIEKQHHLGVKSRE